MNVRYYRDQHRCVCCGEQAEELVCLPNKGVPLCLDCWMEMETEARFAAVSDPANVNDMATYDPDGHYRGQVPVNVEAVIDVMDSITQ